MDTRSDWQLLQEWRDSHSEPAFAALVQRHAALVYSAARRQVGASELAEDVVQEVFVLLARKPHRLREGAIVAGWLHRTARNVASRALRTQNRRLQRELATPTWNVNSSPPSEEDRLWGAAAPHLDEVITELPRPDQEAVVLRYLCDRSLREVGEALGVSEEAARKRVHRAVDRLRELLLRRGIVASPSAAASLLSERTTEALPPGLVGATVMGAAHQAAETGIGCLLDKLGATFPLRERVAGICLKTIAVLGLMALLVTRPRVPAPSASRPDGNPQDSIVEAFRARSMASRQRLVIESPETPAPAVRIVPVAISRAEAHVDRLVDQVMLPTFSFDRATLGEVITELNRLTKLGMRMPGLREENVLQVIRKGHFTSSVYADPHEITATNSASGISLRKALDLIVSRSPTPIRWRSLEDQIGLGPEPPAPVQTLLIEIEPSRFERPPLDEAQAIPLLPPVSGSRVQAFLEFHNLTWPPPFHVARLGETTLSARGTRDQVQAVRRAVRVAGAEPRPPKVGLAVGATLLRVTDDSASSLELVVPAGTCTPSVLSALRFRELLQVTAHREDVSLFEMNSEVSGDGRGLSFWGSVGLDTGPRVGCKLDVIPEIEPDQQTYRLRITARTEGPPSGSERGPVEVPSHPDSQAESLGRCRETEVLLFPLRVAGGGGQVSDVPNHFLLISCKRVEALGWLYSDTW